ncbi:MAG: hypothetical protein AB2551_06165 [Candidatus Thiodiazotropha sp.]
MSHEYRRSFNDVFILDTSKLSRLLNVIEERFAGFSEKYIAKYEITTKKGKSFKTTTIDEITNHDNPINNPIIDLDIRYSDDNDEAKNTCHIQYDTEDSRIRVYIDTEEAKSGSDLFAEIEEQIERSIVTNWIYALKKQAFHEIMPVLMLMIMVPAMIVSIFTATSEDFKKTDYLKQEDISFLTDSFPIEKMNQDMKIEYLYEYHSRKLKNINSDKVGILDTLTRNNVFTMKFALLVLPFVVMFIGVYYIFSKTYIGSIFLWGDYVDYYNNIQDRRKFLWNTVIVALIIGVIGNLFVFGFSQYF